jgi:hypothetical protein
MSCSFRLFWPAAGRLLKKKLRNNTIAVKAFFIAFSTYGLLIPASRSAYSD